MPARWRKVMIVLVISALHQVNLVSSNCVMSGVCGYDILGEEYCFNNRTPTPLLLRDGYSMLSRVCPEVTQHESDRVCCFAEQLRSLELRFKMYAALGLDICPSCAANLKKLWCMLICSPRQSDFVKEDVVRTNDQGYVIVDKVTYFISSRFAEGLFSSCKDIKGLDNGENFLEFACGDSHQEECDVERMLHLMGLTPKDDGYSNIEIKFRISPGAIGLGRRFGSELTEIFHPMNEATFSCSESPFEGAPVCSCDNCEASCKMTTKNWFYDDLDYFTAAIFWTEEDTQTTMNELTTGESTTPRDPLKPQLTTEFEISNAKHTSYPYHIHFSLLMWLLYYFVV